MGSRTNRRSRASGAGTPRVSFHRYGTRLRLGSYIADIVPDDREKPFVHHCIVQRMGSPKVLYLAQEGTFAAALECGHRQLERLVAPHWRKVGAIYEFATVETLK